MAPWLIGEKPYNLLARDDAHRGRVPTPAVSRRRGTALGHFAATKPSLSPAAAECQCCCGSHSHSNSREPPAPAPSPPLPSPGTAQTLPSPEPRRWLPYNRRLLQALIFPANLHIQCLRSTLLWGFRVRTDTGAAGNGARWKPSSSSSSGEARGRGSSSRPRRLRGARGPRYSGAG